MGDVATIFNYGRVWSSQARQLRVLVVCEQLHNIVLFSAVISTRAGYYHLSWAVVYNNTYYVNSNLHNYCANVLAVNNSATT